MASLHEPQTAVRPFGAESADTTGWKPRSALVGTLLANRYRIVAPVGQGSTGAVFRADDIQLNKPVAVRVLVPTLVAQPGLIPRIRARIERNLAIEHREPGALINLVDIFDVGMTLEGELFVVTDFIDGDHLSTMLARGGRLPWSRARHLLVRLCQILHGFHGHGIVLGALEARHCYAVRNKNKHEAIKVVSTAIFEQLASTIGPHAGHGATVLARYVAPEQACGEPIDARSDIYSFGVIAYELLTGSVPFTDANPVRLVAMHIQQPPRPLRAAAPDAGIPAEVESILLRCLAKAPADRHESMDTLANALLAIPESVGTGNLVNVAASLAASEIPAAPADLTAAVTLAGHRASPHDDAAHELPSAGVSPATLAITNRTSPPAEDSAHGLPSAGVSAATLAVTNLTSPPAEDTARELALAPGAAAATLAVTNRTSPPAEDATRPVDAPPPVAPEHHVPSTHTPPIEEPPASSPGSAGAAAATLAVTNKTSPPAEDSTVPVDAPPPELDAPATTSPGPAADAPQSVAHRPSAGVPRTQVTYPPGALSADMITGKAPSPGFGPLRLPPRPTVAGRPATLAPGSLSAPTFGAPPPTGGVPISLPRPPTLGMPVATPAAEPTPAPGPRQPSAALPAGSVPAPEASRINAGDSTNRGAAATGAAGAAGAAAFGSLGSLSASVAAATADLAASQPVPTASSSQPVPTDSLVAADTLATAPVTDAPSAVRSVVHATDIRRAEPASASGTYLRSALADAVESARPGPQAGAQARIEPQPVVSEQALRGAALAANATSSNATSTAAATAATVATTAASTPVPVGVGPAASLSQVSGTTDSLVGNVPRSRTGLYVVLGLAAAAGIAAFAFTSPALRGQPTGPQAAVTQPVAPTKLAQATPTLPGPTVAVDSATPERGVAVVADPPETPEPDPAPEVPPTPPEPEPTAEPEPTPGKKTRDKPGTPRKKRTPAAEEPEEPDVFDQLREHMAKKKAQEEEYAANLARSNAAANKPTPTPTPTPAPKEGQTDAEKAKETLERAKQAAGSGNPQLGYTLAKQSYALARSQEALEIMGTCACRLKNEANARAAHVALSGSPRRASVIEACTKTGITL